MASGSRFSSGPLGLEGATAAVVLYTRYAKPPTTTPLKNTSSSEKNADSFVFAMNRLPAGKVEARWGDNIGGIQRMGIRQGFDVSFAGGDGARVRDRHVYAKRDSQSHGRGNKAIRHVTEGKREVLTRFNPPPKVRHEIRACLRCGAGIAIRPEQGVQFFFVVAAHRIHIIPPTTRRRLT